MLSFRLTPKAAKPAQDVKNKGSPQTLSPEGNVHLSTLGGSRKMFFQLDPPQSKRGHSETKYMYKSLNFLFILPKEMMSFCYSTKVICQGPRHEVSF